MKKILLIFTFLTFVSAGLVQAQGLLKMGNIPDETFLKPIETALLSYQSDFKKWPKNIMVLQNYANKTGQPLDLSTFGKITLERKSSDTVLIVYAIKNPEPYLCAYAITVSNMEQAKGTDKSPTFLMIKKTQLALAGKGYKPGAPDGIMGGKTRRAIMQYQRDIGMIADGKISASLLRKLEGSESQTVSKSRYQKKGKTSVLKVSSLSPEQKRLRNMLKTKMWPNELTAP